MLDKEIRDKYTLVVGLEVHAQLQTNSKIFAADSTQFGDAPNSNISVITLGHPGTLPKLNKKAVEYAIRMGLACHCEISRYNIFDRKNYFYPDLPKGYQITQDKTPICRGGGIPIRLNSGEQRTIQLNRIHLEEDAGKSMHLEGEPETLVDFNRAGVPLAEIVTEPDIRSSEEAYVLLTEIRKLVRYLGICDGNMEEGSLRCDANISVMLCGAKEYGRKAEVKNLNSIRNVQRAIEYEAERQILELEKGHAILSETRTFNADTGTTAAIRTKEELNDYRYFPEPDLSPFIVSDEWLEEIRSAMPSLPQELHHKFLQEYQLPEYDADVLTDSREIAHYFDSLCQKTGHYKAASNWMMGPVKSYLNDSGNTMDQFPLQPARLAELIELVAADRISFAVASQKVFPYLLKHPQKEAAQVMQELNLSQDSSTNNIKPLIEEVLAEFPQKVQEYKSGKKGLLGMFMGEVMKRSKGKVNPKVANELLRKELS